MALGIEQVLSPGAAGRTMGYEPTTLFRMGASSGARGDETMPQTATESYKQRVEEMPRAGFGDGTVSNMAAAARTLDKGVESAERVVPTYQEIREQLKERRTALAEATRNEPFRRYERRRLEVSTQARSFINRLNDVAGFTETRLNGEEVPPPENAPRIAVGGESFAFGAERAGAAFDMLA